jgi:hypothetical protein
MSTTAMPTDKHERFEAICSELSEFEPLPTVTPQPPEHYEELDDEQRHQPLDELILAGLVTPY